MGKGKNPFNETEQVASLTECTGLIPALPQDEQQNVNSAALFAIHSAKRKKKKK